MDGRTGAASPHNVPRLSAGALASGVYAALLGATFVFTLTLDRLFDQFDESANNFVFGALLFLLGGALVLAGLVGYGLGWRRALALALGNPLAILLLGLLLVGLLGLGFPGAFLTLALDALALLAMAALVLHRARLRARTWAIPALLGLLGAVAVAALFVRDGPRVTSTCCVPVAPIPYVSDALLPLVFGALPVVFLAAVLATSGGSGGRRGDDRHVA